MYFLTHKFNLQSNFLYANKDIARPLQNAIPAPFGSRSKALHSHPFAHLNLSNTQNVYIRTLIILRISNSGI